MGFAFSVPDIPEPNNLQALGRRTKAQDVFSCALLLLWNHFIDRFSVAKPNPVFEALAGAKVQPSGQLAKS